MWFQSPLFHHQRGCQMTCWTSCPASRTAYGFLQRGRNTKVMRRNMRKEARITPFSSYKESTTYLLHFAIRTTVVVQHILKLVQLSMIVHPNWGPAWDHHSTLSWFTVQDPRAVKETAPLTRSTFRQTQHQHDTTPCCLAYPLNYFSSKFRTEQEATTNKPTLPERIFISANYVSLRSQRLRQKY